MPFVARGRQPLLPLVDRLLKGKLAPTLQGWRDEGLSFAAMARRLEDDHDVIVTDETVRRWCDELGVERVA